MSARRKDQRGLTLVEVLVAVTILALAMVVALSIYDESRRSYKLGENVAEQQQAVRIAFDVMVRDLRMAGLNANPDGDKFRPDEQLEGLWDTALTLRADFDGDDPALASTPEQTLAGGAFLAVSTANDEIRSYVLAKHDGSSTDTLTFEADINVGQRDGVVETVTIPNVALVHDDPPYMLYRVSIRDDGVPQRTPLIENVRTLSFQYFDDAENTIGGIGGAETPADVNDRARVRRVTVDLEALTRDPDPFWEDTQDANPNTRAFRKFRLYGDVTPRNLGLVGLQDFQADVTPPSQPASAPQLYPGHCDGFYVTWAPSPPADQTAYYRLQYTDPSNVTSWLAAGGTEAYLGGLQSGAAYSVAVQAVDAAGNASAPGPSAVDTTLNQLPENVPLQPAGLAATTGLNGLIDLTWTAVGDNTGGLFGDPSSPMIRDLAGYRLYRSENSGFTPGPTNRIADENVIAALNSPSFADTQAVNCRPYHYALGAVDRCGVEGAPGAEFVGNAWSDQPPQPPTNEQAVFSGSTSVRLNWLGVSQDTQSQPIHIEDYNVFRTPPLPQGTDPASLSAGDFSWRGTANGSTQYDDTGVILQPDEVVFYQVTAFDDCSPVNESVATAPVSPVCIFSGTPQIQTPAYGASLWGLTPVTVTVSGGTGIELYAQVTWTLTRESSGATTSFTSSMTGPAMTWTWDAKPGAGPGPEFYSKDVWIVTAEVEQYIGVGPATCTSTASTRVTIE